jgi:hypothetical protein
MAVDGRELAWRISTRVTTAVGWMMQAARRFYVLLTESTSSTIIGRRLHSSDYGRRRIGQCMRVKMTVWNLATEVIDA